MDIKEYSKLALRTESNNETIDRKIHATLGMSSELAELLASDANIKEEVGDIFWYLNVACDSFGFTLEYVFKTAKSYYHSSLRPDLALIRGISFLSDVVKRDKFYGKEETDKFKILAPLVEIARGLIGFLGYDSEPLTIEQVLEANIKKLETRYPDLRFDSDHAINRNLDKENEALR